MTWNVIEANLYAPEGGRSRSKAKAEAARKNGAKGGRERQSTLAEFIMRRHLTKAEHNAVREGFLNLTPTEKDIFRKMFGLEQLKKGKYVPEPWFNPATPDGVRPTNLSKRRRYILNKVRFVARFHISGH